VSDDKGTAAPDWYPQGDVLRYWDGEKWTEHTAPLTPPEQTATETVDKQAEKQAKRDAKQAERDAKQAERDAKQQATRAQLDEAKAQRAAAKTGDELRPDIEAAMAKMSHKMGSKREIKRLPEHLWPDEKVALMASGLYGPGTGVLVLTDRRLLFVKDGMMSKVTEDFPLDKVSSVQWQTGMMLGTLTIFASGNKAEIKNVQKPDGKAIADAVRGRLAGSSAPAQPQPVIDVPPAAAPQSATTPDAHERLRKLADLHRDGIITDEEFNAKRQLLIDEL
jgi:hypothetical protein